ncbi:hypothetical protein SBC1_02600 [Caballeronia sp. SBC1]|uniref:HEPN/Toprim-associated domain-containing protein n=1 Tax=Caballeronia sp. SBC1 TaxID=2705548 RepID=UPI00140E8DE8|nr:HEPN/Toprim-associated domain-containing protein [Caballeronia sp. SBC1]QIN60285.1 hypothetical protein SBC1_02600 [Caballeronia sp. SBC1]
MQCVVNATIGGYPIASTADSYNQWYFLPEDRLIRCRQRSCDSVDVECVYSVTADTLRRRLGRAGYNRASLEEEFRDYHDQIRCRRRGDRDNLHFTGEFAEVYAEAFISAWSLDDWLDALARAVKNGVTHAGRATEGFRPTGNLLVNIITGPDQPELYGMELEHGLLGFPCSSLRNLAVALLEVTAGNAACELDVTSFIQHCDDSTFDDMLARREG